MGSKLISLLCVVWTITLGLWAAAAFSINRVCVSVLVAFENVDSADNLCYLAALDFKS